MLLMADMRNRSLVIGLGASPALVLTFLVGCGSGTPGGPVASDPPNTLAVGLATSFCAAQAACCGTSGAVADGGPAGTTSCTADAGTADSGSSDCLARATLSAEQQLALVETAFTEGLLTVDPGVSNACTLAYRNVGCPALAGKTEPDVQAALDNPACSNLFIGYIPAPNRCDMTAECLAGTFCLAQGTGQNITSLAGSGTLGVCFPYQPTGGACNTTGDCLPPLTCGATTLTCE
jgi:hypothetical protein